MNGLIFPIMSMNRLCKLLAISETQLTEIADNARNLYRRASLVSAGAATRSIDIPNPTLHRLQRRIFENVFVDFKPHDCSFGGIACKDAASNASFHCGRRFVMKLDVRRFFPSVHHSWVQEFFQGRCGCIPPVASILRRLVTLRSGLPQGTCTSPALADQIFRPIDIRLSNALASRGIAYSRWVDDLTVSAEFSMRNLISFIRDVLKEYGLVIHDRDGKAPRQYGPGESAIITGFSISQSGIAIPTTYIQRLISELARAKRFANQESEIPPAYSKESLWGSIAYVSRFDPKVGRRLAKQFNTVAWDGIQVKLPSKRGRVVFDNLNSDIDR
jgi:RNA-directed DNA polymerase